MRKGLRRRVYGLVGGSGVLATAPPEDIEWTLPRRQLRRLPVRARAGLTLRFFPDGPWDLAAEPFGIHRYVREIFVDGVPAHASEQYRDMVARLSGAVRTGSLWGCRTVADVDAYFERLFALYDNMSREGYRDHTDLDGTPEDEVKVFVGRDGRLIKASGGNHRVSFAKLLGIERVPVLLAGVHRDFVRHAATRSPSTTAIAVALREVGLEVSRLEDIERLAGRLEAGDRARTVVGLPRRRGVPLLVGASLDDFSLVACHLGFLAGS